ncbi:MAG: ATP-binding protein [Armatimonadetes bacterium]|nr:ATP-binding protein [Armatimonadota bacterium]
MKIPSTLFSASLCLPDNAMAFELSKEIRAAAPDQAVLETEDYSFDPIGFADAGGCELVVRDEAYGHWKAEWTDNQIETSPRNAVFDVLWQGRRLTLIVAQNQECGRNWIIVGPRIVDCEKFFAAVCRWNTCGDAAITVFDEGYFERDEELLEEIRQSSLSDLALEPGIRRALEEDVLAFFDQREMYASSGLSWKRGVIFYGPPGNGKTQTIRAIVSQARASCIYVRSLWGYRLPPEGAIKRIYQRARETAPCIVVLEDIDTLVRENSRSYFLNELDGVRSLDGVMTIATTNHLDKLDIALKERPSRFDLKIEFPNPEAEMRAAYLGEPLCLTKLSSELATDVVRRTDGMSFAGLQEFVRATTAKHLRVLDLGRALEETLTAMGRPKAEKPKKKKKKSGSK